MHVPSGVGADEFIERASHAPSELIEAVVAGRGLLLIRGLHDVEIASRLLGHGGERNAYLMRFVTPERFTTPDEEWVVKESRHERTEEEELSSPPTARHATT